MYVTSFNLAHILKKLLPFLSTFSKYSTQRKNLLFAPKGRASLPLLTPAFMVLAASKELFAGKKSLSYFATRLHFFTETANS